MTGNICNFINKNNSQNDIHIVNFVLETNPKAFTKLHCHSKYQVIYVKKGTGLLHLSNKTITISPGDVFFTFPTVPHAIESGEGFEYMYISFLGTRPLDIMHRMNINHENFIFHNFKDELNLWESFISSAATIADVKAECVLLYTFSLLEEYLPADDTKASIPDTILKIKKYVDANISNPDLSLETISQEFSYNKKYISTLFKNKFNIGFSDYVNTVRIQEACTLISQGITSIQDLAYFTGFKDSMYFSRVFKKKMHISPKQHIEQIKETQNQKI